MYIQLIIMNKTIIKLSLKKNFCYFKYLIGEKIEPRDYSSTNLLHSNFVEGITYNTANTLKKLNVG